MAHRLIEQALADWRAAETRLAGLAVGTREWMDADRSVEDARERYLRLADEMLERQHSDSREPVDAEVH